jgi:hypothetical protein
MTAQAASDNSQQPAPDSQAVSQTGLFPVFAVYMNFKASHVDGTDVPSKSPNNGVDSSFQGAWDAVKSGGFNTILFSVDLKDPQAAARVANLCIWAKANNVALIPVLANASGDAAASFPADLVALLRGGDGQQFPAYTQISYFQIEAPVNVPLAAGGKNLAETQKELLGAVDSLRNAESQALQGTGVQATPIIVNASFDYELIQHGAIAGVQLDAAAEQKAQAALKKNLQLLANAANVDAINLTWFPRSISAGDEGHFVGLLREIESALPAKKVLLDTGFSTAFNSADQQSQFMTLSLTNLAGFRAADGSDSRFLGVTISQAFDASSGNAQVSPPASDPSQWNWNEKAKQLAQMWSQGKKSAELTWWLEKVRAGRALLNASGGTDLVPSPGLQAIQQFSATVAQVSQNITPAAVATDGQTTPPSDATGSPAAVPSQPSDPSNANGAPSSPTAIQAAAPGAPSVYSQMLQTLVQQVTTQLTTALVTKLTNKITNSSPSQPQYPQNGDPAYTPPQDPAANYNANSQYSTTPGASPNPSRGGVISLSPQDVTLDAVNPAAGQTVHITAQLHNNSAAQDASGLTVLLLDAANPSAPQASQNGVTVPRSGVLPVQLTWTAGQATGAPTTLMVQVLDANGAQVAGAGVPAINIANASAAANSSTNDSNSGSSNPAGQTAQTTTSGDPAQGNNFSNTTSGTPGAVVQPQIVYFGPVVTAVQNPPLSLQVTNPAATLVRSAQAQLFVDGKPGPVQTLGPLLPSQTRSATFDRSAIASGNHNIKVVVTTTEGASATATAQPAAVSGSSKSADPKVKDPGVRSAVPVRSGIAAGFQIGTVTTMPASPAALSKPAAAALPPAINAASLATATGSKSPTANTSPATFASAFQSPANTPTAPATGSKSPTASTNPATFAAAFQSPANTPAAVAKPTPTDGSSQTKNGSTPVTRSPSSTTVRTIVPPGSTGTSQTGTVATVVPPAGSSQTTPVRTALPQLPAQTNPTGSVTTVRPPGNASPTPAVRTMLPPGTGTSSQTTTVATVLPPRTTPASGIPATRVPATSTTQTVAATTVLPPTRGQATTVLPGQPAATVANGMPGRAYLDLSVAAAEVRFRPVAPGQSTTFTAVIHNLGTVAAQGASVVFMLNADGRITTSRPSIFNIVAGGSYLASWTAPMPAGRSVQLAVQVTANGDMNPANNQAAIRVH